MLSQESTVVATMLDRLETELRRYDRLIIAYSGGVDSGVLLGVAQRVLGTGAIALTADSPSLARRELREAAIFARQLCVEHRVVATSEMELDDYVRNDRNRCFWCKQTLFETCRRIGVELGIGHVAYGYIRDDAGDHRPGHQAAANFGVVSPLYDAGLGKDDVRALARHLGYELWDKPAAPCLSSRIPYGSAVTDEKLRTIEAVEDLLHELDFEIFRARYDGATMRIEVAEEELPRLVDAEVRSRLLQRSRELSVPLLTIDLEGFRSGKLNRIAR